MVIYPARTTTGVRITLSLPAWSTASRREMELVVLVGVVNARQRRQRRGSRRRTRRQRGRRQPPRRRQPKGNSKNKKRQTKEKSRGRQTSRRPPRKREFLEHRQPRQTRQPSRPPIRGGAMFIHPARTTTGVRVTLSLPAWSTASRREMELVVLVGVVNEPRKPMPPACQRP